MFGYLRSDNMVWLTAKRASACCCEHSTFLLFCVCVCVCVCVGGGVRVLCYFHMIYLQIQMQILNPLFSPQSTCSKRQNHDDSLTGARLRPDLMLSVMLCHSTFKLETFFLIFLVLVPKEMFFIS